MTKENLRRLIELSSCCVSREGFEELEALKAEFEAWEPEAIPDESEETKMAWGNLFAQSDHYRESLRQCTKNWSDLCKYWHDRAQTLEARLKELNIPETEEDTPDGRTNKQVAESHK